MAPSSETKLQRYMRIFNDVLLGANKTRQLYLSTVALLDSGFNVNTPLNNGNNLLMHLFELSNYDIMHDIAFLLLSNKINIIHKNNDGLYAINIFCNKYDNEQNETIRNKMGKINYLLRLYLNKHSLDDMNGDDLDIIDVERMTNINDQNKDDNNDDVNDNDD